MHAAIQVRDAIIQLLTNAVSAGTKVGLAGSVPIADDDLPYVKVAIGPGDPKLGMGKNASVLNSDEIELTYMVKEKGDVEAAAFALDLATCKALADNLLGGLLKSVSPGPRYPLGEEQLELKCYALRRVFRVQFQTRVTTPDITT